MLQNLTRWSEKMGATGYLTKSLNPPELLDRIKEFLYLDKK